MRNAKVLHTMAVDHTATARVWSRLCLGILDGTKLDRDASSVSQDAYSPRITIRNGANSIFGG